MTEISTAPVSAAAAVGAPHVARWRRWTAGTLIVLSCILIPLSVVAIWVRNQVLNTDRYVENVTPLASNPAVIDAVALNITNALFGRVNVAADAKAVLPPRADFLAAPLAAGLRELTERAAVNFLSSDKFQTVWVAANRRAHVQLVRALTDTGPLVSTANGKIVLDLSPLVSRVRLALDQRGITVFDHIPANQIPVRFELADAQNLASAQRATRLLDKLDWVLPVLAFVFLGLGLWLSPNRRRTVLRWGIGSAVAVAMVGAGLAFGRSLYLDAVASPSLPRSTAAAVFDTLVRFLREGIRLVIALGLVVAISAWVTGPTPAAVRVRATARSVVGGAGDAAGTHGFGFGRFGQWVARTRGPLRVGVVLAMLVVLLLWNHPRGATVLFLVLVLLVLLALVEFIARAAAAGPVAADDAAPVLGASPS